MPMIRLCAHHVMNPHLIDKLIVIKGLPHDWIFKTTDHGEELKAPWEPDADVNLKEVKHLCEPITFVKYFQPVRHYDRTYDGFWDKRTVLGLKLDYAYGPGKEMWENILDYIDRTLPRGQKMPDPIIVAKDQKSHFEPHLARRSRTGSGIELVPSEVPVIDLTQNMTIISPPVQTQTASVASITLVNEPKTTVTGVTPPERLVQAQEYKCEECLLSFEKPRGLMMHTMKKHPSKEKVTV